MLESFIYAIDRTGLQISMSQCTQPVQSSFEVIQKCPYSIGGDGKVFNKSGKQNGYGFATAIASLFSSVTAEYPVPAFNRFRAGVF